MGIIGIKIFLDRHPHPMPISPSAAGRQPVDSYLHSRAPFTQGDGRNHMAILREERIGNQTC